MNYRPKDWEEMSRKQKAFVVAAIQNKVEAEKRELAKIKNS